MEKMKYLILSLLLAVPVFAADKKAAANAKPFPLNACVVTDEKFGGDMGDPYVFVHEGREMKLCCKSCLKEFNKNQAKYVKKWDAAAAKKKK